MITERQIKLQALYVPDWIDGRFVDKGCQGVRVYKLTADEADDLLKDFFARFREKFVLGKDEGAE